MIKHRVIVIPLIKRFQWPIIIAANPLRYVSKGATIQRTLFKFQSVVKYKYSDGQSRLSVYVDATCLDGPTAFPVFAELRARLDRYERKGVTSTFARQPPRATESAECQWLNQLRIRAVSPLPRPNGEISILTISSD